MERIHVLDLIQADIIFQMRHLQYNLGDVEYYDLFNADVTPTEEGVRLVFFIFGCEYESMCVSYTVSYAMGCMKYTFQHGTIEKQDIVYPVIIEGGCLKLWDGG